MKTIMAALIVLLMATPALPQSVTLVTVGDSLTAGDGDDGVGGGYPARLLSMLQSVYPGSTLSNRAVSGDTSQDLINRQLDNAVADLDGAPAENLKIAIVWIGSNDMFGLYAGDVCTEYYPDLPTCEQTEMGISYANVNTILGALKATGATLYIARLDDQTKRPVIADPALRNEVFPGITDDEVPRMAAQIINFNNEVDTHAATHGAQVVDFYNTTIFETDATLSDDGNHPNGAGYDAIARIWYAAIAGTTQTYYRDADNDGYGDIDAPLNAESRPEGYVSDHTDCDDGNAAIHPGAEEIDFNGIDEDCDGKDGGTVVFGNIDGSADGAVTLADAILALQVCGGLPHGITVVAAEINKDNRIGLAEAIFALQQTARIGPKPPVAERVMPNDLEYLGAFRLPDAFYWGARGMSYYPAGNDGAGSLLVTASEALRTPEGEACYEGLTNCAAYFAEVTIPAPAIETDWTALPEASYLTGPATFDGGLAQTVHPAHAYVTGIAYVPRQGDQSGDKLYGSLNEWYPEGGYGDASFPTVWFSNLDGTDARGVFHVGPVADPLYHGRKMGDFLFSVPQWYADAHLGGRFLVTGRSRGTPAGEHPELTTDGGSQGPTLFAFRPLASDNPPAGTELDALPMLYYRVKYPGCAGPDIGTGGAAVDCDYPDFSMCDSWSGGSFIGTREKNAIALLGRKGTTNCYYCDETGEDPECHASTPPAECVRYCNEDRGYHCGPYRRQIIFYDTGELADVARGAISPWEVLPYEIWSPPDFFLSGVNVCGDVGGMAYDETNRRLFVIERGLGGYQGDNAAVVHVYTLK